MKQFLRAPAGQRIDPELAIVGLAAPAVTVFGTIADEEQHRGGRQALDHALEDGLRLAVEPMEILHHEHEGLGATLAQQQEFHGFQCATATRGRFEAAKAILFGQGVEQPEGCGEKVGMSLDPLGKRRGHLGADCAPIVPVVDPEIAAQESDDG